MFIAPCDRPEAHEPHVHTIRWPKFPQEPAGWFPPGSYAATIPEGGHDAEYRCRGHEREIRDLTWQVDLADIHERTRTIRTVTVIAPTHRHAYWKALEDQPTNIVVANNPRRIP